MKAFCLMFVVGWCIVGCTGQAIEGRWRGPLPYRDAKDCRIKLFSNGSFELACQEDTWVGAGRYEYAGDQLTLKYSWLSHNKEMQKEPLPIVYEVKPAGNTIKLRTDFQDFTWQRTTQG